MGWFVYAAYAAWLLGNYAYHRLFDEKPRPPLPTRLKAPTSTEGAPIPLVYGRCLVRQPILAWWGHSKALATSGLVIEDLAHGAPYFYCADLFFALGIGFRVGTHGLHRVFSGDTRIFNVASEDLGYKRLDELTGGGGFEQAYLRGPAVDPTGGLHGLDETEYMGGNLEFLDGRETQTLLDAALTPRTYVGDRMVTAGEDPTLIPGYRGVLSVFLFMLAEDEPLVNAWILGTSPQVPAYSFDVSSYPAGFFSFPARIGDDCNPIVVLSDLLTGGFGKLEIPGGALDVASFNAAGKTLADEQHGYSRCIDARRPARDHIKEILEQIDAVLYEDPRDSKVKIKLVRADYVLSETPLVHPGNCDAVENYVMSGQTDGVNAVNVQWTDRAHGYVTGSARAMDNAAVTATGGAPDEINLQFPGCCTKELAETLAARELAARSQPLARCSVIVDRSLRDVMPGDVVRLSWPEYHLNEKVFRVGQVDRGTLTDGRIRLDLVQDFFFVSRRKVHPGHLPSFPTPDLPASTE